MRKTGGNLTVHFESIDNLDQSFHCESPTTVVFKSVEQFNLIFRNAGMLVNGDPIEAKQ